jgi:glycosyltransferase involved in cell wall biosynthesis
LNVAIICERRPTQAQGVADHAALLLEELARRDHNPALASSGPGAESWARAGHASLPLCEAWNRRGRMSAVERLCARGTEAVVLEYTPYLYQARGLPLGIARLPAALEAEGIRVVSLLHELYIPWWLPPQRTLAGAVQRLAAVRIIAGSRSVGVNFVGRHRAFLARWGRGRWEVTPSPANLPWPDRSPEVRAGRRQEAGAGADDLLLVLFGSPHQGLPLQPVVAALEAMDRARVPWKLAVAGPVTDAFLGVIRERPRLRARTTGLGFLQEQRLSDLLASADMALFPYEDGISSRRGTLAAAWQAALPVVSTDGRNTDAWLRESRAATLAPAGDEQGFARAALTLAQDAGLRLELGRRAAALYRTRFDWEVIGAQVDAMLRR